MANILKKDASIYEVESHNKGEFYTINLDSKTCTCPHYQFRLKRFGGECKHIIAVRDYIAANTEVKEYKSRYKGNNKKAKKEKNNKKVFAIKEEKAKSDNTKADAKNDITLVILKEVQDLGEIDSIKLLEKYGEVLVNDLIAKGYLTEKNDMIRLMK